MQYVINLTLGLLALSLMLCFVRLVRGPSLPDRVMALELFSVIMIGMIGVHTIKADVSSFLDVAIVVALMSFLATVAFARFLERGGQRDD